MRGLKNTNEQIQNQINEDFFYKPGIIDIDCVLENQTVYQNYYNEVNETLIILHEQVRIHEIWKNDS